MDWIKKMNAALNYIEENLVGEINYSEAARRANCSVYHFQRVFSCMAGVSLAEYIRRRRLTLAAFDLQKAAGKVIDIALKYGYDSPTSFSRAFQLLHQMTPSEARASGKMFTSYPPISFQITIKGVSAMNYRIEKKEAIRIVGFKLRTEMLGDGENSTEIPEFWAKVNRSGRVGEVSDLINQEPLGLLGVCAMIENSSKEFDYYIAAATDKPVPEGMEEYTIPASAYAVFDCVGPMPKALQDLWSRIFTEWLPNSGYEYGPGADMEVYSKGDTSAADYKCQAWLPIAKI